MSHLCACPVMELWNIHASIFKVQCEILHSHVQYSNEKEKSVGYYLWKFLYWAIWATGQGERRETPVEGLIELDEGESRDKPIVKLLECLLRDRKEEFWSSLPFLESSLLDNRMILCPLSACVVTMWLHHRINSCIGKTCFGILSLQTGRSTEIVFWCVSFNYKVWNDLL